MEFLFDNPFIIIIILGFLSSLFKNKNEKQEKSQQKQKNKPFEKQKPFVFMEKMEPVKNIKPKPIKKQKANVQYEKLKEDAIAEIGYLKNQQLQLEAKADKIKNVQVQSTQLNDAKENISDKKLVDAIIWAEILGPPRSKRPHKVVNGNRLKRYT